jgi:hypothetical protein
MTYNFDHICNYMTDRDDSDDNHPYISELLHQADMMAVTGIIDDDTAFVNVTTNIIQRIIDSKNTDLIRILDICVSNIASVFHPEHLLNGINNELRIQYGYSIFEYTVFHHMHTCISQFFKQGSVDTQSTSYKALININRINN